MKEKKYSKNEIRKINDDYYNKNANSFYESTLNVDMSHLYTPFLELIPKGATILDAGCGSGRDSLYFSENGYKVVAIDSSKELVDLIKKSSEIKVLNLSFDEIDFVNEFDAVWACASLLHIPKSEINHAMAVLIKVLKQNGILYTSFKYGDDEGVKNGRFFNNYNEESFKNLISAFNNIKIEKIWKTPDARKGRENEYWLNSLVRKV